MESDGMKRNILGLIIICMASICLVGCSNSETQGKIVSKKKESKVKEEKIDDETKILKKKQVVIWDVAKDNTNVCEIDIDSDGKKDRIKLEGMYEKDQQIDDASEKNTEYMTSYNLYIDGAKFEKYGDYVEPRVAGFSPDGENILLGIFDRGPSEDPHVVVYSYKDNSVVEVGMLTGTLEDIKINKDGTVNDKETVGLLEVHTANVKRKWNGDELVRCDEEDYELIPHEVDGKEVTVTLKKEIKVYNDKDLNSKSTKMKPQKVKFTKTDLKKWVYIEAKDGTKGWLDADVLTIPSLKNVPSSTIFDGLTIYD